MFKGAEGDPARSLRVVVCVRAGPACYTEGISFRQTMEEEEEVRDKALNDRRAA